MPTTAAQTSESRFTVRARHLHGHHARAFGEATPEAAVAAYLEDFAHDLDEEADGEDSVALIVRDEDTGHEQCFRIDLATGETAPCG